jgi:hypothetical protein
MSISCDICAVVRRSVQIDNTVVIFCSGSNILRAPLAPFVYHILSRIIGKFFFKLLILPVDEHSDLALLSPDH